MLKILINVYACNPYWGSEPGLGWNWVKFLGKYCKLFVITEGEWRENIEKEISLLPYARNIHFYYLPVSEKARKMCWNQGDWRFYKHYKTWQLNAFEIAKEIIKNEKIDIVHQLNMQGFREPGYLWKIDEIPFVWGPIGGMSLIPEKYLQYNNLKSFLFYKLKNSINLFQIKYHKRVHNALERANLVLSSTPDEVNALLTYHSKKSIHIPDTGTFISKSQNNLERFQEESFNIIWVGKFDFRKQLNLALKTISSINPKYNVTLNIVGTGSIKQVNEFKKLATTLKIDNRIKWHDVIPNENVFHLMSESQLFFFTSISEATSTVVLEAISNSLPVLCFNACGFGAVIDEKVGIKIPLTNPEQSVKDFAEKINYLFNNRQVLKQMSENCAERQQELSWDRKAVQMVELYKKVIEEFNTKHIKVK